MSFTPTTIGRAAAQRFGPTCAGLILAITCFVGVIAAGLPLGMLAQAAEAGIDRPFVRWMDGHQDVPVITRQMTKISVLADIPMTQVLAVLGALVLAYAYRRRWWIPVTVISFAYFAERLLQPALADWVDRGHPVGAAGTYPSGGVARTLTVYGAILACALVLLPPVERTGQRVMWGGLVVLAALVGVSRLWLDKHWLSDVVTGFPVGLLILAFEIAVLAALTSTRDSGRTK